MIYIGLYVSIKPLVYYYIKLINIVTAFGLNARQKAVTHLPFTELLAAALPTRTNETDRRPRALDQGHIARSEEVSVCLDLEQPSLYIIIYHSVCMHAFV